MTETLILANAVLVLPDEVRAGAVHIEDGQITAIDTGTSVPKGGGGLRRRLPRPRPH